MVIEIVQQGYIWAVAVDKCLLTKGNKEFGIVAIVEIFDEIS